MKSSITRGKENNEKNMTEQMKQNKKKKRKTVNEKR